jgi:hypothetical protein
MVILDKDMTMDNVQKHNICTKFSKARFWCHLILIGLTDLLRSGKYNRI